MKLTPIIVFLFLICSDVSYSQIGWYNHGASVYIGESTPVGIKGDIVIDLNGGFVNHGTLHFDGDWINNNISSMSISDTAYGSVVLKGSGSKILGGISPNAFPSLKLLCDSALLGSSLSISSKTSSVSGRLDIGDTRLSLSGFSLNINNSDSNAIFRQSGFIVSEDTNYGGIINWCVDSTRATYMFPLGNNDGTFIPLKITSQSGDLGVLSVASYRTAVDMSPLPKALDTVHNFDNLLSEDNSINAIKRFWHLHKTGDGIMNIEFSYADAELPVGGEGDIQAWRWNTNNWNIQYKDQDHIKTLNKVLVYNVDSLSSWTLVNNSPPIANQDTIILSEDELTFAFPMSNDVDPDGNTLTMSIVDHPQSGNASVNGDTLFFNPNSNFTGMDSMLYAVCDDLGYCDTAFISLVIQPINDAPVAIDDYKSVEPNTTKNIDVQENDYDVDNDTLITNLVVLPQHGMASILNVDSIQYQPNLAYFGQDSLSYRICDAGGLCDTAWLFLLVDTGNQSPIASMDTLKITIDEDSELKLNLPTYIVDPDEDELTFSIVQNGLNGNVSILNLDSLIYQPDGNYVGKGFATISGCDQTLLCDSLVLQVEVTEVNDTPIAENDIVTVLSGELANIAPLDNDFDIDSNLLTISLTNGPFNGSANIINNVIQYTSSVGFIGYDSIYYNVCDDGIPSLCDQAKVIIRVDTGNLAPYTIEDTLFLEIDEDHDTTLNIDALFFDLNNDTLDFSVVLNPENGVLQNLGAGVYKYVPEEHYFGRDSFMIEGCDDEPLCSDLYISVIIRSVNDTPVVNDDTIIVNPNETTFMDLLKNDFDVEDSDLFVKIVQVPTLGIIEVSNSDSIFYTSFEDAVGEEEIIYSVCDEDSACGQGKLFLKIKDIDPEDDGFQVFDGVSPNNDGKNDFFIVQGIDKYPDNEISIFNRWGTLVFQQKNYQNDWYGQTNQKGIGGKDLLPSGTYYYVIERGSNEEAMTGNITLLK